MARAFHDEQRWGELAPAVGYNANKLAGFLGLTPRQLRRQFQCAVHCSPQAWLDDIRLAAASQRLLSGRSVKAVAIELGYKDPAHFCHKFKAKYGMAPSAFAAAPPDATAAVDLDNKRLSQALTRLRRCQHCVFANLPVAQPAATPAENSPGNGKMSATDNKCPPQTSDLAGRVT